jgi:hypothetical protein
MIHVRGKNTKIGRTKAEPAERSSASAKRAQARRKAENPEHPKSKGGKAA